MMWMFEAMIMMTLGIIDDDHHYINTLSVVGDVQWAVVTNDGMQ